MKRANVLVVLLGLYSFLCVVFAANVQQDTVTPDVRSIDCAVVPSVVLPVSAPFNFDECLIVTFSNHVVKFARLQRCHESDQVLEGVLYDNVGHKIPGSRVSVTRHDSDETLVTKNPFVRCFLN